jgi:FkbH-like protein
MPASPNLRKEIDQHLAGGNWEAAHAGLHQFWNAERSSAAAGYVVSCYEKLRPFVRLIPCRVAILRSFTLEPVVPLLRATALLGGIDLTVHVGGFDTYAQQILDPNSDLYKFNPDTVILAIQTRDIAPELWESFTDHSPEEQAARAEELHRTLAEWTQIFRSRSAASLIIHNFERPARPNAGILDGQGAAGQDALIQEVNRRLRMLTTEIPGVCLLDYDGLVSRHGRNNWHDERKWLTMRMPIGADNLLEMAQEWLRFLHPLTGRTGKVLVTDLDNTLWGGVIGEDGMQGIKLGREYPGAAYYGLQRVLLDLHNRGILLAIASKNNEADAMEVLSTHPEMLLRPNLFASLQINWNSKAESLRRIAEELNVGLDSLVFVDDNPVERQNIRVSLPQVTVIELPEDSMGYAKAVQRCPLFDRVTASAEDGKRAQYYVEQRQRQNLQKNVTSVEDFYYSLNQKVEIARVSKDTLIRTAQLIKKTNQFNLTTRRHSESQVAQLAADSDSDVYLTRVADRFGDNGIVGVTIVRWTSEVCEIDSMLLSCRVIGRTVETAILHFLAEESRARGIGQIVGWFLPTEKNKPAEGFYADHHFTAKEKSDIGTLWSLDLRQTEIACPPWIQLSAEHSQGVEAKGECAHA